MQNSVANALDFSRPSPTFLNVEQLEQNRIIWLIHLSVRGGRPKPETGPTLLLYRAIDLPHFVFGCVCVC